MSKQLSQILSATEPLFAHSIRHLEKTTGKNSLDIRLAAEIAEKVRRATKDMGLDPFDTSGLELYSALLQRLALSDQHLRQKLGISDEMTINQSRQNMQQAVNKTDIEKSVWVLKKSVAKDFLRQMPPPNIMQQLNYTSVESMLKHENINEIYGALRFSEGPDWLNRFNENYKRLTPADFTTREIEIVIMPERWSDLCADFILKKKHNITHLKELGVILMLPVKQAKVPGLTLWATSLLFHYVNEIRLYSSFFRLKMMDRNFGKVFVETLIADPGNAAVVAGENIHWRVIQRYFGKLKNEDHPEIFQPHLQPEDLHWRAAEEWLVKLAPELEFWLGLDYVAMITDDGPVSLNLLDVAASYSNKTEYADREVYHMRAALWNELFARYMGHSVLREQILQQLDNDMVIPERIIRK